MNLFIGIGNLVKDAELRYTTTNVASASFSIAINREYSNSEGKKDADYINIQVWGKLAENVAKYTHKGSKILIEGRLQVRSYEKEGKKNYITEVVANKVTFLSQKKENNHHESLEDKTTFKAEELDNDNFPFDF